MNEPHGQGLPHIVVLGAGFAGLRFCQTFPEGLARVTLVDRQNHHLFQPLLYQVATAGLAAPDIAEPIRSILRKKDHVTVLMAAVEKIDLAAKRVTTDRGELAYDHLVIAVGGRTSYFGHPEWERHAPGLKSLDDALLIRRKVLLAYERAETEPDEAKRRELLTTVVIGGGPTGLELAGTLAELAKTVLRCDFTHIDPARTRVVLVEGGPRLLPAFPEELSESAKRQLEKLGVEVRLNAMVKDIRSHEVELPEETLRAGNIFWGAGVGASPLTKDLGVETDRAGRLKVLPDLSLPGRPEVFAAGDIVTLKDANGVVVPGVAQGALQMGAFIADLLEVELQARRDGRPSERKAGERPAFAYRDKGNMATIGRSAAVAQIGKRKFSGWPAWAAWLAVHLVFLVGFRNRMAVLMQWMYSYFTYKRGARIITGGGG